MKTTKKLLVMLLAVVMVFAMVIPAMAAELPTGTANADKTITITRLLV